MNFSKNFSMNDTMKNQYVFLSMALFIFTAVFYGVLVFSSSSSYAAKAMNMPYCEITGEIIKIEERKEEYENESWRKSWGLPKYTTYTDITVRLTSKKPFAYQDEAYSEAELQDMCGFTEVTEEVFQNADQNITDQWVGLKIWAVTNLGGDEFMFGNWLLRGINASQLSRQIETP